MSIPEPFLFGRLRHFFSRTKGPSLWTYAIVSITLLIGTLALYSKRNKPSLIPYTGFINTSKFFNTNLGTPIAFADLTNSHSLDIIYLTQQKNDLNFYQSSDQSIWVCQNCHTSGTIEVIIPYDITNNGFCDLLLTIRFEDKRQLGFIENKGNNLFYPIRIIQDIIVADPLIVKLNNTQGILTTVNQNTVLFITHDQDFIKHEFNFDNSFRYFSYLHIQDSYHICGIDDNGINILDFATTIKSIGYINLPKYFSSILQIDPTKSLLLLTIFEPEKSPYICVQLGNQCITKLDVKDMVDDRRFTHVFELTKSGYSYLTVPLENASGTYMAVFNISQQYSRMEDIPGFGGFFETNSIGLLTSSGFFEASTSKRLKITSINTSIQRMPYGLTDSLYGVNIGVLYTTKKGKQQSLTTFNTMPYGPVCPYSLFNLGMDAHYIINIEIGQREFKWLLPDTHAIVGVDGYRTYLFYPLSCFGVFYGCCVMLVVTGFFIILHEQKELAEDKEEAAEMLPLFS